jgi:tetratricopeptide (TPR) repeat protein
LKAQLEDVLEQGRPPVPTVKSAVPAELLPPPPVLAPVSPPPPPAATAAVYHARGRKLIEQEKFAEAVEQLNLAIQIDPSMALAHNARGFAFLRLKQYAAAIADFDAAIRLNPAYANAYRNRAAARRASGDKTGSSADQAKAVSLAGEISRGSRTTP